MDSEQLIQARRLVALVSDATFRLLPVVWLAGFAWEAIAERSRSERSFWGVVRGGAPIAAALALSFGSLLVASTQALIVVPLAVAGEKSVGEVWLVTVAALSLSLTTAAVAGFLCSLSMLLARCGDAGKVA